MNRIAGWNFWNLRALLLGFVLAAITQWGMAQVTASIIGKVEDASGAAVPEASVSITSQETGAIRSATTDQAGNYRLLSLPVGRYDIRAEKSGFKARIESGINLVVGQEAVVNLNLEVGDVQQQVTVTAEAPLVNTTTASVAGLVGEKQVKDLPLNGRSFDNLITLNAGAVNFTSMKGTGAVASSVGNLFTVSGRRPHENLFLLNGVEYTGPNQTHSLPGGVSGQLLGIDAVREFNVVSDAYSAEYGKRAGAQVSVVTQSGTNKLHGSLFEFLRNSKLDARNFFDQGSIPPFKRNQFGGAAGGPIKKDKTFIFGNYEGFRQRLGLSAVTIVPDDNARKGLLPCVSNGTPACAPNAPVGTPTPVPGLVPAILNYMVFWPEPNGDNLGGGAAKSFSNPKQSIREDFGTVRGDQNFSGNDSLSGVYTVDDGFSTTPNLDPLFGTVTSLRNQVVSLQETHIFSPTVLNTLTLGLSRAVFIFNTPPLASIPANLSFVVGEIPGNLVVGGGQQGNSSITQAGSASTPHWKNHKALFTYQDGLQITKGRNQINAGVWFQQLRSNELGNARASGQATFASLLTFLQGNPTSFAVVPSPTIHSFRQLEGAWYVQDSIQVRPNLTLRLGLRHEFTNGWNDAKGKAANVIYDTNGVMLSNALTGNSALTENNAKLLFSPRIGLAWDPFGKGKTSIRAGAGTYYTLQDSLGFILKDAFPFNGTVSFSGVPLLSLVPVHPDIPQPPVCGPGVPKPCTTFAPQGVQPSFKTPTVEEWNFSVEQQITANTALTAGYVGSHGYHQFINVDYNSIHPLICASAAGCTGGGVGATTRTVPSGAEYIPVGTRPNPYLSNAYIWFAEGTASYNALRLELKHRFNYGLEFRANYTWSKDLNIGTGVTSADAQNEAQMVMNPYQPKRDWGPSAQDVRNQFSFSGGYELPFGHGKPLLGSASGAADKLASGWQLNWIVTALGGFPVTPIIGANISGNGDSRIPDRPSLNPAFSGPKTLGNPNKWYDPSAYILPVNGTWGNMGRGVLKGPGLADFDMSLFKSTRLTERMNLQFRAEFFNLLNRANFSFPNMTVFSGSSISPSAGLITATTTTSRQIQFGLKLVF